jgi:hypothetical protein
VAPRGSHASPISGRLHVTAPAIPCAQGSVGSDDFRRCAGNTAQTGRPGSPQTACCFLCRWRGQSAESRFGATRAARRPVPSLPATATPADPVPRLCGGLSGSRFGNWAEIGGLLRLGSLNRTWKRGGRPASSRAASAERSGGIKQESDWVPCRSARPTRPGHAPYRQYRRVPLMPRRARSRWK